MSDGKQITNIADIKKWSEWIVLVKEDDNAKSLNDEVRRFKKMQYARITVLIAKLHNECEDPTDKLAELAVEFPPLTEFLYTRRQYDAIGAGNFLSKYNLAPEKCQFSDKHLEFIGKLNNETQDEVARIENDPNELKRLSRGTLAELKEWASNFQTPTHENADDEIGNEDSDLEEKFEDIMVAFKTLHQQCELISAAFRKFSKDLLESKHCNDICECILAIEGYQDEALKFVDNAVQKLKQTFEEQKENGA